MSDEHQDMLATVDEVLSDDNESKALAKSADVPDDWSGMQSTEDMKAAASAILISAGSKPTPEAVGHVVHQMLAGRELGLSPLASVRLVSVDVKMDKGKPRVTTIMSAQMMAGLARKAGWSISLKYGDKPLSATVTMTRGDETIEETWDEEDAKRAGLWGRGLAWPKFPKQMLRWRAVADASRIAVPELLAGVYAHEEMDASFGPAPQAAPTVTEAELGGDE